MQSITTENGPPRAVVAYLDAQNLKHGPIDKGLILVPFRFPDKELALDIAIGATDETNTIDVVARTNRTVPRERWGKVLWRVNGWNERYRTPRARLALRPPAEEGAEPDSADILLDAWLPIDNPPNAKLIERFLDLVLAGTFTFWGVGGQGAVPAGADDGTR